MSNKTINDKRSTKQISLFLISFFLLFTITQIYGCNGDDSNNGNGGSGGNGGLPATSEELAFQHIEEAMNKFNEVFDVYTDLSEAGNHFVTLGRMSRRLSENSLVPPEKNLKVFSDILVSKS